MQQWSGSPDEEIHSLIAARQRCPAKVVLVTNEIIGDGIVPENRLARHFAILPGRVNQRPAAAADEGLAGGIRY